MPIKRHTNLQAVSHEHHHGLLFCRRLTEGLKQKIALERLESYSAWMWQTQLLAHFDFEEVHMFPILGDENRGAQKALKEHASLKFLFASNAKSEATFESIAELLMAHIRFEERQLFQEIEAAATPQQLQLIAEAHKTIATEKWPDAFWL